MTKLLFVCDPHLADQPPMGRVDDYATNILAKLEEVGRVAAAEKVSTIIFTGDIWHQKRANRVSHSLVNRLINLLQTYPTVPLAVFGNHDLSPAGVEGVERQPIWTLVQAGNLSLLDEIITVGDVALVGRHWSSERASDPSYYALTEKEKEIAALMKYTVLVCHAPMLPPGQTRIYDSFSVDQVDLTGIDVVVSGHIHERLGAHQLFEADPETGEPVKKFFVNLGSISRATRTKENLVRTPAVLLLETGSELLLRPIPLKNILPVGQIFEGRESDDGPEVDDEMAALVDRLAEGLQLEERSLPELLAEFGDIDEPVLALVLRYLEEGGLA